MCQIPVVMGFAGPDRPREVRMEAAYFLQQLCQSRWRVSPFIIPLLWFAKQIGLGLTLLAFWCSSLTLQMFIACRGIPILVGFLEADHAKYRFVISFLVCVCKVRYFFPLKLTKKQVCLEVWNGAFFHAERQAVWLYSMNFMSQCMNVKLVNFIRIYLSATFVHAPRSSQTLSWNRNVTVL
jgi:hypothetical protein